LVQQLATSEELVAKVEYEARRLAAALASK
jgi:hypothetical protein